MYIYIYNIYSQLSQTPACQKYQKCISRTGFDVEVIGFRNIGSSKIQTFSIRRHCLSINIKRVPHGTNKRTFSIKLSPQFPQTTGRLRFLCDLINWLILLHFSNRSMWSFTQNIWLCARVFVLWLLLLFWVVVILIKKFVSNFDFTETFQWQSDK